MTQSQAERPVTRLAAEPAPLSDEAVDFTVAWDDLSEAELQWKWDDMHCPQALPPLAGYYMCKAITDGFNYYLARAGVPVLFLARAVNGYVYFTTRLGIDESERPALNKKMREVDKGIARTVRDYWDAQALPAILDTYAWMRDQPIESAPLAELATIWEGAWARAARLWELHFVTVSGCYQALDDLADLYESLLEGAPPSEALSLVQGTLGDLQRVQRDLYLLTEQARSSPLVARPIEQDPGTAMSALPAVDGGVEFLERLDAFLQAHGHLGQAFDDLSLSSWQEEPSLVLSEVRKRLLHPDEDPEERRLRLAAESNSLAARAREHLKERPNDLRRFDEALALARLAGPLTEDHNYWLDRMLHAHLHRFAVRVGSRLVEAGVLAKPHDIFFLHMEEIRDALQNPTDLTEQVSDRKADLERWRRAQPPIILGKPRTEPPPPDRFGGPVEQEAEEGTLRGVGASAGRAIGPARVVLSPDDFESVQPGDILVCPASNPSWVPLFGIIAGLVTNTGGVLAHASVTAREFGVPAVVGTRKATGAIQNGQIVEVDGSAGIVRILS